MDLQHVPPPPPTPTYRLPGDGTVRPTYWLYSEAEGMEGPYTKMEARQVLREHPGIEFFACREGEEWQYAKVRLARKKESHVGRYFMALILLAAVVYGAWRWHLHQKESRALRRSSSNEVVVPSEAIE